MESPLRRAQPLVTACAVVGLAVLPVAGCARSAAEGASSCADVVEVAGNGYQGTGQLLTHLPAAATRTLSVTSPICGDGDTRRWEGTRRGTALPGVDPAQAFWLDGTVYTRQDQVGTVLGLPALTSRLSCRPSAAATSVDGTLLWAAGIAVLRTTDRRLLGSRDAWVQLPVTGSGSLVEKARGEHVAVRARITCVASHWAAASPSAR